MRHLFIATALVLAHAAVTAQSIEAPAVIGFHMVTAHSKPGFCNVNPGVYAVWANGLTLGAYRNSECERLSAYAGWSWQTEGRFRAGLSAGLVTGYRRAAVQPFLLPSVAFDVTPTVTARATFIPKVEKRGAAALHFSVEFPF